MNTKEISSPFYLQWHADGQALGVWNGSDKPKNFKALSTWSLSTGSQYEFNFTTDQGESSPYTVFAVIRDTAGLSYGAKFVQDPSPAAVSQLTFTPQGALIFTAGQLISGDPKVNISASTNQPSAYVKWTAAGRWEWSYTSSGPVQPYKTAIPMGPGNVLVHVSDETSRSNVCAVYYVDSTNAPGTNVGIVQSETLIDEPNSPIEIRPQSPTSDFTCTLNLFTTLPIDAELAAE